MSIAQLNALIKLDREVQQDTSGADTPKGHHQNEQKASTPPLQVGPCWHGISGMSDAKAHGGKSPFASEAFSSNFFLSISIDCVGCMQVFSSFLIC